MLKVHYADYRFVRNRIGTDLDYYESGPILSGKNPFEGRLRYFNQFTIG